MDTLGWSAQAHRRHKAAVSAHKTPTQLQRETERMKLGPRIEGHTLIVPSEWHNEQAASFWRAHGFHWREWPACTWERDTRIPQGGKIHTAKAWLQATRAKFFEFWPQLKARPETDCRGCEEMFEPTRDGQRLCTNCEAARQIYRQPAELDKNHYRQP